MRQALFKLLKRHASADWKLAEETPVFLIGRCLNEVPTALVQQAGRSVQGSQIQAGRISLGSWQPDIVGISLAKKKVAIGSDVTLPSDSWREALQAAYGRRLDPTAR